MPLHLRTLLRHRAVCCALSKVLWQMHKDLRYNRKFKERRRYNNTLHHIYHTPSTPHSNSVLQKPTIFSHTHTIFTLCAAKLHLHSTLQIEVAAKFCKAGYQSNRRKHEVWKGKEFWLLSGAKELLCVCPSTWQWDMIMLERTICSTLI